ncbi:MAG: hypothetical protein ACNS60_01785 [Candidatus Cyclobacteriaceae bacterium M2_1C_046]
MRALIFIVVLIFLFQEKAVGAELVITGVYQGKDLYVQNPYSSANKKFCTEAVYINDQRIITEPNSSGYRINLSKFQLNERLEIKIVHREGCTPKILNPDVIQPKGAFEFITINAGRTSISWIVKDEMPGGEFYVQRKLTDGEWEDIEQVPGKGGIVSGNYQLPVSHMSGVNFYRIRFEGPADEPKYSTIANYDFKEEPVTFFPSDPTIKITLSREAEYLVTDKEGNKYLEGKNDFINVKDLPSGEYILHIQNRKEPFVIKRELKPIKKKKNNQIRELRIEI